ncbi:hypothetical protein FJT64_016369 [Amphibalanus amphitrite]|uniref:DUF7041 domain-containing protein n=1 Tax=Amphibalanus amphitrite TaxID=1232801 RepID=A0A6A4WZV6_AMPAM|nr:hypothetical protein FJT64_016369 [Amphibalanus amphitrite]
MDQTTQPASADAAAAAASHAAAAAATAAQPDYLRMATAPRSHVAPPRFFEEDPVIWLVQLDLFFSQAAVDDELSRFRIAATLLPGHLLRDFTDILRNPPPDRPYTILSDAIRQRFGNHVAPPRFFEEDPVIWLVQLDLFFSQAAVDDELSRFRIAATLLPGHLLRDFTDILRNPPPDRPYTILSDAIRQRFGNHVAPPRFFEEDPVIWLVQLDLFFSQAAVDDELSRFRIAATLLPGHLLRDFTDILRNPPPDRPYTILSDAIRQRFGNHVAPPRFFEEDPVIWLVQLDLFFSQAAVDDELSRFRIAATLLPGHLLRDFTDILRNPPPDRPYTILSDAIRQRFGN